MWSDAHPSAPIAYRFGTVILPAPSWISWSVERHFVTLTRLANGYGFSIMDYKVLIVIVDYKVLLLIWDGKIIVTMS